MWIFLLLLAVITVEAKMPPPSKDMVLALAQMSAQDYQPPTLFLNGYHQIDQFGWQSSTIRGYVYQSNDNSTIVVSIKGTSPFSSPTSGNDQFSDNLMFSCCCGSDLYLVSPVCDCFHNSTCDNKCVAMAARNSSSYYQQVTLVVRLYQYKFPQAQVMVTGHSLGGGLAALVAVELQIPAITFEAPGEFRFGQSLGLYGDPGIYHFGNTADPIFMGTCNGLTSSCQLAGYALQTKCHFGQVCVYNSSHPQTVYDHQISVVIDDYIIPNPLPECYYQVGCSDC